jgi:hypothetical protein
LRAEGVIRSIHHHTVPSLFTGQPGRHVARIELAFESLTSDAGAPLDPRSYLGLAFEGAADLTERFREGERVAITTTTPTGMHIATIERVTVH